MTLYTVIIMLLQTPVVVTSVAKKNEGFCPVNLRRPLKTLFLIDDSSLRENFGENFQTAAVLEVFLSRIRELDNMFTYYTKLFCVSKN